MAGEVLAEQRAGGPTVASPSKIPGEYHKDAPKKPLVSGTAGLSSTATAPTTASTRPLLMSKPPTRLTGGATSTARKTATGTGSATCTSSKRATSTAAKRTTLTTLGAPQSSEKETELFTEIAEIEKLPDDPKSSRGEGVANTAHEFEKA